MQTKNHFIWKRNSNDLNASLHNSAIRKIYKIKKINKKKIKILILGITFKRKLSDIRNSQSLSKTFKLDKR